MFNFGLIRLVWLMDPVEVLGMYTVVSASPPCDGLVMDDVYSSPPIHHEINQNTIMTACFLFHCHKENMSQQMLHINSYEVAIKHHINTPHKGLTSREYIIAVVLMKYTC